MKNFKVNLLIRQGAVVFIFLAVFISFFGVALADGEPQGEGSNFTIPNPLSCSELQECVKDIINSLIILAAPVVAVMVVIGGFQILTAGGDPEKFSRGRKTILYAAVGFGAILLATGVVYVITDILGTSTPAP